jgi:endo-1,4-beta-D-glucanase Y
LIEKLANKPEESWTSCTQAAEESQRLWTMYETKLFPLVLRTANTLFSTFSQTHFMAWSLTMLCILARIWVILHRLVELLKLFHHQCLYGSDSFVNKDKSKQRNRGKQLFLEEDVKVTENVGRRLEHATHKAKSTRKGKQETVIDNSLEKMVVFTSNEPTKDSQDYDIDDIFAVLEK